VEKLIGEFTFGLFFWQTALFLILLFLLRKFAWKPTLKAVNAREQDIEEALNAADLAKVEMRKLKESNDALLQEARAERDEMLKEARDMKNKVISEAKHKAQEEADKIITSAREEIKNEKSKAINELKNQIADFSIDFAEKILSEKMADADKQKESINTAIKEINFN
jgi:F-type H+-transporting ATPase subunit b